MIPSDEVGRIWKEKYGGYNQEDFGVTLDLSASKMSEIMTNKMQIPLRVVKLLVEMGGDATLLIQNNIKGR